MLIDFEARSYSRCSLGAAGDDCDRYGLESEVSGVFTILSPSGAGRASFLKVFNDGLGYVEVASAEVRTVQHFGSCEARD